MRNEKIQRTDQIQKNPKEAENKLGELEIRGNSKEYERIRDPKESESERILKSPKRTERIWDNTRDNTTKFRENRRECRRIRKKHKKFERNQGT